MRTSEKTPFLGTSVNKDKKKGWGETLPETRGVVMVAKGPEAPIGIEEEEMQASKIAGAQKLQVAA